MNDSVTVQFTVTSAALRTSVFLTTMSVMVCWTVPMQEMNVAALMILVIILSSLILSTPSLSHFLPLSHTNTVPGLPFYHPPAVCPDSSDNLGPCDISECQSDMECREDREEEDETEDEYEEDNGNDKMCCLNNCNQMSCTRPTTASPACRAVVQRLSANFSYIPQCDADGDYQPVQCTGEGTTRRCWCVNVRSGIPYTTFSSNDDLNCKRMS